MLSIGLILRLVGAMIAVLVLVGIVRAAAFAYKDDPAANAEPEEVDPAGELASLIEPIRASHKIPGMAAAVIVDGKLHAIGVAGVRESGGTKRIALDDPFHLGSCTKAMTATLLATLVDHGELSWTTTLSDVFTDVPMHDDWRDVTLEQLLHHRGGAPAHLRGGGLWEELWDYDGPMREARRLIVKRVTAEAPGTRGKYIFSNAGYTIAGAMAEAVMDRSWEQLMREHVFEPLGMTTAGFGPPGSEDSVDAPRGHTQRGKSMPPGLLADNPQAIGPAGTVHCSIEDWARFVMLHLGVFDEDESIVAAETIERMRIAGEGSGEPYAMGWIALERAWARGDDEDSHGLAMTHAGTNTLWYATTWLAPERSAAVLVAANQGGGRASRACDAVAIALVKQYILSDDAD